MTSVVYRVEVETTSPATAMQPQGEERAVPSVSQPTRRRTSPGRRRKPHRASPSLHRRLCNALCSFSTVVTVVYFALLVCLAVIVTSTTQARMTAALMESWSAVHRTRCVITRRSLDAVADFVVETVIAAAALYTQSDYRIESNNTRTMLCATLAIADPRFTLRALNLGNAHLGQYISAAHGDRGDPSPRNMTVLLSDNNHFYGVFYVDPDTYEYGDPPVVKGTFDQSRTVKEMIDTFVSPYPVFQFLDELLNGTVSAIPPESRWYTPTYQPSFIYHTMPVILIGSDFVNKHYVDDHDFVQIRLDGAALLDKFPVHAPDANSRVMVLATSTLDADDPIVLADNWGQEPVLNGSYAALVNTNTTYLTVGTISDPLMRAAVQHVDFKALQQSGYSVTTTFTYRNAPAMVSAVMYKGSAAFELPFVLVSPQHAVIGPYYLISRICTGMLGLSIALLTALCFFAIDRYLSRPLREVTAAMEASVERGVRQPVRGAACDVVQLAETRELACAYNAAMAQLRVVDAFVPDAVRCRNELNSDRGEEHAGGELQRRYLTILTVHITPLKQKNAAHDIVVAASRTNHNARSPSLHEATDSPLTPPACYGPFKKAVNVENFVGTVLQLRAEHRGVVHRLTPDLCVLHFGSAAMKVAAEPEASADTGDRSGPLTPPPTSIPLLSQRLIARDAQDAMAFGFALLHWVDQQQRHSAAMFPDMRLLADTGIFTCGRYKALGSEQTMSVAFGRDVDRSLGHLPVKLGVRLAMTEETASCLRGGVGGNGCAAACGVRQLPIEAIRTGRVGLDANVVILYEALPGAALGHRPWRRYSECAFGGFSHMLRGDYAKALTAFRAVADIADLEPGLIPARFRREAARTNVTGGATSVQIERLMCECERRIATHWTRGFHRTPIRPLGMDVVLAGMARQRLSIPQSSMGQSATRAPSRPSSPTGSCVIAGAGQMEKRRGRYGLDIRNPLAMCASVRMVGVLPGSSKRTTFIGAVTSFQDNWGKEWFLGRVHASQERLEPHARLSVGLSASGMMSMLSGLLYCDVPAIVSAALEGVPNGPMSDAARAAVPLWLPSPVQREAMHKLFGPCLRLRHNNVVACLGYSIAFEGGVVVISERYRGPNLRELRRQFPSPLPRNTITRIACSTLKGLTFLHLNGIIHGELRPECVLFCSDGVCRLKGFFTDYALAHRVLCIPRTCYVSPEVAAGAAPTAASDVFGFGLVLLELLTRERPWVWAPVSGEGPQRSPGELMSLMEAGGDDFGALVTQQLVVPAVELLDRVSSYDAFSAACAYVVRRCVEWRAEARLSLKEALNSVMRAGRVRRSRVSVPHSFLHFGDSDEDDDDTTSEEEGGSAEPLIQLVR